MQTKRIKDTGSVVIVFEGYEVPNHIKFGSVLLKCCLYRRQVDVCYICAKVGHRADVCPTPEEKTCRGCGVENPTDSHECKAKCKLCGHGHPTGDRNCKQRYQTPFIVRPRRTERIEESTRERQPPGRFEDFPPIEERVDQRRSQGVTPRSESAGPRSQCGSRPGHLPTQTTWAQKAGGMKAQQETMEKSLAEITSILQQLRVDVGELKKQSADHGKRLGALETRTDEVQVVTPKEKGRIPHLPSSQSKAGADGNSKFGNKNGGTK
ncbi:hypothetical protein MTO96_017063 [Rhipicephalus appendiculatus]